MIPIYITSFGYKHQFQNNNCEGASTEKSLTDYLSVTKPRFFNKNLIHREDRNLLNFITELSIDATHICMSNVDNLLSLNDREVCKIFASSDSAENSFEQLFELFRLVNKDTNKFFSQLGQIKDLINPLDMLRRLSTNLIYHLSKIYQFNGGGYPLHTMSLGGMVALASATNAIKYNNDICALVNATGDMLSLEALASFYKLGMLNINNSGGINPSYASVSIFLTQSKKFANLAEIIEIKTNFFTGIPNEMNWNKLYEQLMIPDENLYIILYNNGNLELHHTEHKIVKQIFPKAFIKTYKTNLGYTGKANNLLDLCLSLEDESIPNNAYIMINGIGFNVGIGYILLKKIN
jgi:hypothetical protein